MPKMRVTKERESACCECGREWKNVSEMYDLKIGDNISTICRKCSNVLFQKLLKAACAYDGRVKTNEDMARIRRDNAEHEEVKGHLTVSQALKGVKDE